MSRTDQLPASFRDPSGFLFSRNGILYRQINRLYADHYTHLMESGLCEKLVKAGLLIPHVEAAQISAETDASYKIIQPQRVEFISYPYEWSFSQLKDAALATLSIQLRALKFGMTLKDASAYNIQFVEGCPTLIDTLSFEVYQPGKPWEAYRQFCQHFLAPLALMSHRDIRLAQLFRVYIDGIPLDLASSLLPTRTKFSFGLLTHLHLHAGAQRRFANATATTLARQMNLQAMTGLIENLEATVRKLSWKSAGTEWAEYYGSTNYTDQGFEHKKELVRAWAAESRPAVIWDLGGNTGMFSREAAASGAQVVSFDGDPAAVEQNYLMLKRNKEKNILPLLLDLANPSPASGWDHRERESFAARGPADMILALALIHHLAISNNVPLINLAEFFSRHTKWLMIEYVPKSDSQAQKLLASRRDIFPDYTREGFEAAFSTRFRIQKAESVKDSGRILYLLEVR